MGAQGAAPALGTPQAQLWLPLSLPEANPPQPRALAPLLPRNERVKDTNGGVYYTFLCKHLDTATPDSSTHTLAQDEQQFQ